MHLKWILFASVLLVMRVYSTSATKRKSEDEISDNSLTFDHKETSSRPSALYSIIQEATVPTFIVMGLATLAAALNNKNEAKTEDGKRKRRSPTSAWTENLLRILGNVQKAVEKYQQLENEIVNELDEDFMRDFGTKSAE